MSDRCKPPKGTRKTPVPRFPAWCRCDVEEAIERLLAVLDAADPDLEANRDDEPSLAGYPTTAVEILNSIRARTNTV